MQLLFISLTNRCNRSCDYCPIAEWRNSADYPDSLTLEKCIKAIEFLKPTHAEITGGEPTLVPWLGELTDWLDAQNIIYLVKSNGHKRCKNQITAWHDAIPVYYDKVLIIKGVQDWQWKEHYCIEHGISYRIIGKDGTMLAPPPDNVATFFLCPDGHLKQCKDLESDSLRHIDHIGTDLEQEPKWMAKCRQCKSVGDFFLFLEDK